MSLVKKYGATSYDNFQQPGRFEGKERVNTKDLFLRLSDGENKVRLLTDPHMYVLHKFKDKGDEGFGRRILCTQESDCPVCEIEKSIKVTKASPKVDKDYKNGLKAKARAYYGTIERKEGTVKILDASSKIIEDVKGFNEDSDWGDPRFYDINIKVNKKAPPAAYYNCFPNPKGKGPLSDSDLALKAQFDEKFMKDMEERCVPPTKEAVLKSIEKYREWRDKDKNTNDSESTEETTSSSDQPTEGGDAKLESSTEEDYKF